MPRPTSLMTSYFPRVWFSRSDMAAFGVVGQVERFGSVQLKVVGTAGKNYMLARKVRARSHFPTGSNSRAGALGAWPGHLGTWQGMGRNHVVLYR